MSAWTTTKATLKTIAYGPPAKSSLETRETLEAEIKKIADEFELHAPYMPSSDEIIVFKRGLSAEIAPEIPLPLQEKINIWKKLVESREQEINNQKPFKIFGNEETIIYRNYYNGCNPSVKQFTKNLFAKIQGEIQC